MSRERPRAATPHSIQARRHVRAGGGAAGAWKSASEEERKTDPALPFPSHWLKGPRTLNPSCQVSRKGEKFDWKVFLHDGKKKTLLQFRPDVVFDKFASIMEYSFEGEKFGAH